MRKCFEKDYIYLTHTLNRDNPNFNYRFLIQSDIPCNVGDLVVVTSQREGYAIAEIIDGNGTYTVDNDNYVVEFDETKTRYNGNSIVMIINNCSAVKLYRELQKEKNANRNVDPSLESILALFGGSLAMKKAKDEIERMMNENKSAKGDVYSLKNDHIMIANEKYQSLFLVKNELNCIFFDGTTIYYEKVSKTQKFGNGNNEISNRSSKTLSLLLGTVDEVTEPELMKQAVRSVTKAKLKEFTDEYSDMLKAFTIEEIINNSADVPMFNDFINRRKEIFDLMMKENCLR